MQATPFWDLNFGHMVEIGLLFLAYVDFRASRAKDAGERERVKKDLLESQAEMHAENKGRLATLFEFQRAQLILNEKRDQQISLLSTQSARLTELAAGQERRLQMLEDRNLQ